MGIYIGGNEIDDIKIGSTDINEVYIGSNLVWQRLNVTANPPSGQHIAFSFDSDAQAQVDLTANRSVSWSFSLVSGTSTGLSYGASSGTGTYVRMFRDYSSQGVGESQALVDVTATVGGSSVTTRVTVSATVDTIGGGF